VCKQLGSGHSPDQQEAWKKSDGDEVEDGRENGLH